MEPVMTHIRVVSTGDDLLSGFTIDIIGPIDDEDVLESLVNAINMQDTDAYRVSAEGITIQHPQDSEWTSSLVLPEIALSVR